MEGEGRRKRVRCKRKKLLALDRVRDDVKDTRLLGEEVYNCATWRRISSNIDPS